MSCWRRTTVLRIPAICLGFVYRWEWEEFLEKHEDDFQWEPCFFASALCSSYSWEDYSKLPGRDDDQGLEERLDLNLYPDLVKSVPGPFLDYYLEEIIPLPHEENSYHDNDCARLLTEREKEKYLPLYQKLFPDFTLERMRDVHFCSYEWYDGTEAYYLY